MVRLQCKNCVIHTERKARTVGINKTTHTASFSGQFVKTMSQKTQNHGHITIHREKHI